MRIDKELRQIPVRLRTGRSNNRKSKEVYDLDLLVRMYKRDLDSIDWSYGSNPTFFKTRIYLKQGYVEFTKIDTGPQGFFGAAWKAKAGDHNVTIDDSKDRPSLSCQLRVYAGGDHWQSLPTTRSHAIYFSDRKTLRVFFPIGAVVPTSASREALA